jgi:lambda repressor-like predicted transcriptional regulator
MKTEDADALLGRSSIHPKQEIMLEEIIAHLKEAGKTLRKLMEIL